MPAQSFGIFTLFPPHESNASRMVSLPNATWALTTFMVIFQGKPAGGRGHCIYCASATLREWTAPSLSAAYASP
jgi:hypothetical protein